MTADATDLVRGMNHASTTIERSAAAMLAQVKNLALGVTAALAIIGTVAVREAMKFEDSFAGVRKTVQATEEEYRNLEASLRDLAKQIPINVNEINRVAEAAGQLGIANETIVGFTKVMIELGTTTNMSSDEAASALARLANITQMNQKDFDRLGATLVALGYSSASTEKEIADMALRIAGAGHQIGMTNAEILSFAAGLSSVGIQAEMGGSAISQTMIRMAEAVTRGGATLETFSGIAGMSSDKFRAAFKDNAAQAVLSFIEGLHEVSKAGGDVFGVLDELGIDGIRMTDLLLRASGAGDLFRETLETGSRAWAENTALTEAAEKRYTTFSSQLTITWNLFKDILITVGQELMPVLKALNNMLQGTMTAQNGANGSMQNFISNIAPVFLKIVGLIGDAIWGWKLIIKVGQVSFLTWASVMLSIFQMVAEGITRSMEGIVKVFVDTANKAIKVANILRPKFLQFQKINFKLKFDTSSIDDLTKGTKEALVETLEELNSMVEEGSFSDRLKAEYAKVTQAISIENAKIVEDAKKTAEAIAMQGPGTMLPKPEMSQMEKDSAAAMRTMAMIPMPESSIGQIRGLRGLEDPKMRELGIIDQEMKAAQDRLKTLESLNNSELQLTEEVQAKKTAMIEAYNDKLAMLQMAQSEIVLGTATTMFGDLTQIAADTAGKQSGIYKTMFAMSKAFAIAESIIKIQQGIAAAASVGWPANIVAMGSVVAATASIVSTIQATRLEFGGGKALGGPVQKGKFYKVGEEGEEWFAPSTNGTIVPNDKINGGGQMKVVVNNYTDATATVSQKEENGERVTEILIQRVKSDIASELREGRGDVNRALESSYSLRRGRR